MILAAGVAGCCIGFWYLDLLLFLGANIARPLLQGKFHVLLNPCFASS